MAHQVLIIDDDEDIRFMLKFLFETKGIKALVAENGQSGLDLLFKLDDDAWPEVIILDWIMPEMSGLNFLETLSELRSQNLKQVSVLILSGMDVRQQVPKIGNSVTCINKPFDMDELFALLQQKLK